MHSLKSVLHARPSTKCLGSLAAAAVLLSLSGGTALADPINFTWSPSGAAPSLSGGDIVNANNYNIADFTSISINSNTGAFTETGALNVLNFLNGGTTVSSPGLGSSYGLYLVFNATGTQDVIPTVNGTTGNGTFNTLNYRLIGSTSGSPPTSFTVSNGAVAINDPGTDAVLGDGSLTPGTGFVTLTKTANGYSPTANVNLSFNECLAPGQDGVCSANEGGFFLSPTSGLSLQVGNFSATDTVTTASSSGGTTYVNLNGGSGNLTFQAPAAPVPEPATLALLGAGLVGLGVIRRKRA